jgi:hypothetical protein
MLRIQCDVKIIKMHKSTGLINRYMLSPERKAVVFSSNLYSKVRLYLASAARSEHSRIRKMQITAKGRGKQQQQKCLKNSGPMQKD